MKDLELTINAMLSRIKYLERENAKLIAENQCLKAKIELNSSQSKENERGAQTVNRWIPCSERLPHGGRVLAATPQGFVLDIIFVLEDSQWYRNGEYFPTDAVIAWMPLPDAYKQLEHIENIIDCSDSEDFDRVEDIYND